MARQKSDTPPFQMVVEKGPRLAPATASDAERLDTWRVGSKVNVSFVRNGSRVMERKWWAVLGLVVDRCNVPWTTKEQASEAIKLALDITNMTKTVGGAWMLYPKSLTELDDAELDKAVSRMMDLITEMTGIDPETLRRETADVGRDETEQPEDQAPPPASGSGSSDAGTKPSLAAANESAAADLKEDGAEPDGASAGDDAPSSDARDPLVILNLKAEAVAKFLELATNKDLPDPRDRRGVLVKAKEAWKRELPHHHDFLKACVTTADAVIKGQMPADKAREYLEAQVK